jgi:hypothetical protein
MSTVSVKINLRGTEKHLSGVLNKTADDSVQNVFIK